MNDHTFQLPLLQVGDENLKCCKIISALVKRDDNPLCSADIAQVIPYVELRDAVKAGLERATFPEVTFDGVVTCPRASMLVAVTPAEEPKLTLHFLDASRPESSLLDAIVSERRLTERNELRWIYQLVTILVCAIERYIVLKDISMDDISLPSDYYILSQIKAWNKMLMKIGNAKHTLCKAMTLGNINRDLRQLWLNLIPTTNPSEDAPNQWCQVFPQLRSADAGMRSGQLNKATTQERREELFEEYTTFILRLQRNYRQIGMIVIQLVCRTLFTDEERRFLNHYHFECSTGGPLGATLPASPMGGDLRPGSPMAGGGSRPVSRQVGSALSPDRPTSPPKPMSAGFGSTNDLRVQISSAGGGGGGGERGASPSSPQRTSTKAMLKAIQHDLCTAFPALLSEGSKDIHDLVSIFFAPMDAFLSPNQNLAQPSVGMAIPHLGKLKIVLERMRMKVVRHYQDSQYQPPDVWSKDLMEFREARQKEIEEKSAAKTAQGLAKASARVRQAKFQLWWEMQSDEYKARKMRMKEMRQLTEQRLRDRQTLVEAALFHRFEPEQLHRWLTQALTKYFLVALRFQRRVNEEHQRKLRKLQNQNQGPDGAPSSPGDNTTGPQKSMKSSRKSGVSSPPRKASVVGETSFKSPANNNSNTVPVYYHPVHEVYIDTVLKEVLDPIDNYMTTRIVAAFSSLNANNISNNNTPAKGSPMTPAGAAVSGANSSSSSVQSSINNNNPNKKSSPTAAEGKSIVSAIQTPTKQAPSSQQQQSSPNAITMSVHQMTQEDKVRYCLLNLLAPHLPLLLTPQFFTSLELAAAIREAIRAGEEYFSSRTEKILIISVEQRRFKLLAWQSQYLQQHFPAFRSAAFTIGTEVLGMVDRGRARHLASMLASACIYFYQEEIPLRYKGENEASLRMCAFFRMILTRKRYRIMLRALHANIASAANTGAGSSTNNMMSASSASLSTGSAAASSASFATRHAFKLRAELDLSTLSQILPPHMIKRNNQQHQLHHLHQHHQQQQKLAGGVVTHSTILVRKSSAVPQQLQQQTEKSSSSFATSRASRLGKSSMLLEQEDAPSSFVIGGATGLLDRLERKASASAQTIIQRRRASQQDGHMLAGVREVTSSFDDNDENDEDSAAVSVRDTDHLMDLFPSNILQLDTAGSHDDGSTSGNSPRRRKSTASTRPLNRSMSNSSGLGNLGNLGASSRQMSTTTISHVASTTRPSTASALLHGEDTALQELVTALGVAPPGTPLLTLLSQESTGDTCRLQLAVRCAARWQAEELLQDLAPPPPSGNNNNNISNSSSSKLSSNNSDHDHCIVVYTVRDPLQQQGASSHLVLVCKSHGELVFERYGGFVDAFHQHSDRFVPHDYQRVTYTVNYQEVVIPPPPKPVGPQLKLTEDPNSAKSVALLLAPSYEVIIDVIISGLQPVSAYRYTWSLSTKLADKLCESYWSTDDNMSNNISRKYNNNNNNSYSMSSNNRTNSSQAAIIAQHRRYEMFHSATLSTRLRYLLYRDAHTEESANNLLNNSSNNTNNNSNSNGNSNNVSSKGGFGASSRGSTKQGSNNNSNNASNSINNRQRPCLLLVQTVAASASGSASGSAAVSHAPTPGGPIYMHNEDSTGGDLPQLAGFASIQLSIQQQQQQQQQQQLSANNSRPVSRPTSSPTPLSSSLHHAWRPWIMRTKAMLPPPPSHVNTRLKYRDIPRTHHNDHTDRMGGIGGIDRMNSSSHASTPLLWWHLQDERPPGLHLHARCELSWPTNACDRPQLTSHDVQRRWVLLPREDFPVDKWRTLGLIDTEGDGSYKGDGMLASPWRSIHTYSCIRNTATQNQTHIYPESGWTWENVIDLQTPLSATEEVQGRGGRRGRHQHNQEHGKNADDPESGSCAELTGLLGRLWQRFVAPQRLLLSSLFPLSSVGAASVYVSTGYVLSVEYRVNVQNSLGASEYCLSTCSAGAGAGIGGAGGEVKAGVVLAELCMQSALTTAALPAAPASSAQSRVPSRGAVGAGTGGGGRPRSPAFPAFPLSPVSPAAVAVPVPAVRLISGVAGAFVPVSVPAASRRSPSPTSTAPGSRGSPKMFGSASRPVSRQTSPVMFLPSHIRAEVATDKVESEGDDGRDAADPWLQGLSFFSPL